jgi:hypothetical protein
MNRVYGVEFRDMHTGIHNVIEAKNEKDAFEIYDLMKELKK